MTIRQLINLGIYDDYEKIVIIACNTSWDNFRIVCKTYLSEIPNKYKKLNIDSIGALSDSEKSKFYIRGRDGFTGIYVVEDLDDINEIEVADKKEQADRIATKLRRTTSDRWDYDLCKQLCELAELSDEWNTIDKSDVDNIIELVYEASDILGVTV